jgi:hypothetical protein
VQSLRQGDKVFVRLDAGDFLFVVLAYCSLLSFKRGSLSPLLIEELSIGGLTIGKVLPNFIEFLSTTR